MKAKLFIEDARYDNWLMKCAVDKVTFIRISVE